MPRELRGQLRNLFVEEEHALVGRLGFIGDRHQQGEPVVSEQRSLRRTCETIRHVDRGKARRVPVNECLAQAADVTSRGAHQPVAQPPMLIKSLLLRNLSGRCDADEVVREPHRATGINGDASRDKLTHRPLDPAHLPPLQLGRVAKGQRTSGNCEQPEHAAGVAARAA